EMVASSPSDPPTRHEIDDLFSVTTAAAMNSRVLICCGPFPQESLEPELYRRLVKDVRAQGTTVIADLSPPRLDHALAGGPDLVKVDDWQLAEYVRDDVGTPERFRAAAERLIEHGARAVIATRGGDPALVLGADRAWELVPPKFEEGASEGSGESRVGALGAAIARGLEFEDALRVGAAAGAANFLRH